MWPRGPVANSHPAAKILHNLSTEGCPLDCGEEWSEEHLLAALKRGPHISAKEPEAIKYLLQETQEKIKGNYLKVVKWGDIKHNHPKNMKISPIALIPHKSRSFRCILDLSFQLKVKNKKLSSVNKGTRSKAPKKAMAQLGHSMNRIINILASHHDKSTPFYFSKCNIKDGFWRMSVSQQDAWNFCYVLPSLQPYQSIDDIEIVVPHALQMGWTESPPYFCTATETARDIIDIYLHHIPNLPQHPLEKHLISNMPKPITPFLETQQQINNTEVYVDDFIGMTNNLQQNHILQYSRAILHSIHSIFPPPSVSKHKGEDPISVKKLIQGEGLWHYKKELLGWDVNGKEYTIQLPKAKQDKLITLLTTIIKNKKCTLETFQKLQGKLIHASTGIPNGKGLLSVVFKATINKPKLQV